MSSPIPLSGRQPRAVRTALRVLEEVVAAGAGVTAKEISRSLDLPPATTYRVLNLLVAEEYLVRLPDLRGFALGRRAARLSLPQAAVLNTAARTVVAHMRTQTRWAVHLAVFTAGQVTLLDADPDHPRPDDTALARYPHAFALGQLLLADQPDWRALTPDLRSFTQHTVTAEDELSARLARVATDDIARQCGEFRTDRGCIAVAIRDPGGQRLVAGLALSGPPDRVAAPNLELVGVLREHARRLCPLLA